MPFDVGHFQTRRNAGDDFDLETNGRDHLNPNSVGSKQCTTERGCMVSAPHFLTETEGSALLAKTGIFGQN